MIDLDSFVLRSGQAKAIELALRIDPPVVNGEALRFAEPDVPVRVDISRTTSGYALRLRTQTAIEGECSRCLGPARWDLAIDAREVDQTSESDPELRSPYVSDAVLDVAAWTHDAITLAIPEQLLCKDDCLGLCEECGTNLNEVDPPGSHKHEAKLDPRFAKLRDLTQ
jgi:uncharacterized protein